MNVQNFKSASLVNNTNLNVHLKSAWPQNGFVQEIFSIGDTYDKDVVELIDSIYTGEQLVQNVRINLVGTVTAPFFAEGIDFIENNTVQLTFLSSLILVFLSSLEQLSDIFFTDSMLIAHDFGSVHYLRLNLEDFTDLSSNERFACAWGSMEKDALDVFESEMSHNSAVDHSGAKYFTTYKF